MVYVGTLAKNKTRSIYDIGSSKEVANIHQRECDGKVILRIEPKLFLSDNHVKEYETWFTLLKSKVNAELGTRNKEVVFAQIDDKDFEEALKNFYQK